MNTDKVCAKTCTECALGSNSPFDDDAKEIIRAATEAGIVFNCHWPEMMPNDTLRDVENRVRWSNQLPLCHTGMNLLGAKLARGAFSESVAQKLLDQISKLHTVDAYDVNTIDNLLQPGQTFVMPLIADVGLLSPIKGVQGKTIERKKASA